MMEVWPFSDALRRKIMMTRTFFTARAVVASLALAASGCGLFEPRYEKYGETASENPDDPCVTAALSEFAAQIEPAIAATCGPGCHIAQTIGDGPLIIGDPANNRARFKAYASGDADKLFNKISLNNESHSGGDVSASLPKATIDAWLATEVCD
jgi:hypothetical protein